MERIEPKERYYLVYEDKKFGWTFFYDYGYESKESADAMLRENQALCKNDIKLYLARATTTYEVMEEMK